MQCRQCRAMQGICLSPQSSEMEVVMFSSCRNGDWQSAGGAAYVSNTRCDAGHDVICHPIWFSAGLGPYLWHCVVCDGSRARYGVPLLPHLSHVSTAGHVHLERYPSWDMLCVHLGGVCSTLHGASTLPCPLCRARRSAFCGPAAPRCE